MRENMTPYDKQMNTSGTPFIYPGVQLEPSMAALYGVKDRDQRKRFRLGNQMIAREWRDILKSISWDAYPHVSKDRMQTFLQAELGYAISTSNPMYSLKSIHAMINMEQSKCVWYISIETDELDDLIVLRVHTVKREVDKTYKIAQVEFMGFTPQDKVAFPMNAVSGKPQEVPLQSEYNCYGSNILHRNTIPGAIATLDRQTVHTLKDTDYAVFSSELDSNWPTLLHPDSQKKPTG